MKISHSNNETLRRAQKLPLVFDRTRSADTLQTRSDLADLVCLSLFSGLADQVFPDRTRFFGEFFWVLDEGRVFPPDRWKEFVDGVKSNHFSDSRGEDLSGFFENAWIGSSPNIFSVAFANIELYALSNLSSNIFDTRSFDILSII